MRVLFVAPYIYKPEWKEFSSNPTGFGMMVNSIYESVQDKVESYLITQVITPGHEKVLKHEWIDVFSQAKVRDWIKGINYFLSYKQSFKNRCRYFYYALNAGTLKKAIQKIHPDIIHVHGIGIEMKPYIDICNKSGVPYIITLHGLIGLDDSVSSPVWDREMERKLILDSYKANQPISVISSGMKRRIENEYLNHKANNIRVICNGTKVPFKDISVFDQSINLREKYNINPDEKIIVVIGSLCSRKNQEQLIRITSQNYISARFRIFLCGNDVTGGKIENLIVENHLNNKIYVLGFVPHSCIEQILDQADLNVVASKDEGFGLSIIEAFNHGVPTVAFSDIDAIPDLFSSEAMIIAKTREDHVFAKAIEDGLKHKWNKDKIIEHGKQFSIDKIASQYVEEYGKILVGGGTPNINQTIDYIMIQKRLGKKIVLYIGNITDNKNQIGFISLEGLFEDNSIIVVLAGREADNGRVRRMVIDNNWQEKCILEGFCSDLDALWACADLNVLISRNDGFGLSVVESSMRGVPSLMDPHLDAFQDVCGSSVFPTGVCGAVKDDIGFCIRNKPTKATIGSVSKNHSIETMADEYIEYYYKVLSK